MGPFQSTTRRVKVRNCPTHGSDGLRGLATLCPCAADDSWPQPQPRGAVFIQMGDANSPQLWAVHAVSRVGQGKTGCCGIRLFSPSSRLLWAAPAGRAAATISTVSSFPFSPAGFPVADLGPAGPPGPPASQSYWAAHGPGIGSAVEVERAGRDSGTHQIGASTGTPPSALLDQVALLSQKVMLPLRYCAQLLSQLLW